MLGWKVFEKASRVCRGAFSFFYKPKGKIVDLRDFSRWIAGKKRKFSEIGRFSIEKNVIITMKS